MPDSMTMARFSLSQQHPITLGWADERVRLAALARDHDNDVMLSTDLGVARIRRDRFAPGRPVEVMLNRWVTVGPDLEAMLSMRYEGGDPDLPFVDASVLSRAVTASDLDGLAEAARREFGELDPDYLRIWSAEPTDQFPGTWPDKRFLAAPLCDLRDRPVPAELCLRPTADLAHYAEARRAYAAVDAEFPDHRRQAALAAPGRLAELLDASHLFDVRLDDHWVGYVGVRAEGLLGLPGFTVQELVLSEAARGQGRGRHLSTLLARTLPGDREVLIGTIHQANTSSLRAAVAAGRHDVGGWFALPLTRPVA